MLLPSVKGTSGSAYIQQFAGLNRRAGAEANEFCGCVNLSNDEFPCISSVRSPLAVVEMRGIQAVCAPRYSDEDITSFTGVAGGVFYYMGEAIPFESGDMSLEGDIQLADFNGTIIMCPQMYYFSYTPDYESGEIVKKVRRMTKGLYGQRVTVHGEEIEDDNGNVTDYENYIRIDDVDFSEYFASGDSVFIEGFGDEYEKNNSLYIDSRYETADDERILSAIVSKVKGEKLYVRLYNRQGKQVVFEDATAEDVSVYINIPTMNCVAVHNNRLWGTNPNGEQIYASKIGDPFNFFSFEGLTSDSWYSEVGTGGEFVGVVSYRDNVVAFKRDFIHHVYGDKPINFSVPKQLADCGCIDIRTAAEVGTVLYYLGYNGFYAYSGGQPMIISDKLARRYTGGVAWTDGVKYFVSATDENGDTELLVYDTRYSTWQELSPMAVVGAFRWHNNSYVATADTLWCMESGEWGSWKLTTAAMTEGVTACKSIVGIFVHAELGGGASMSVSTITQDGYEIPCRTVMYSGRKTVRIPVRFKNGDYYRIIIKGTGKVTIHGLERIVKEGGRNWSVHI